LSGSTCRQAGVRRHPPFGGVATAYPCQTTHTMTLPATLSGFRLAHPAGPMRLYPNPSGQEDRTPTRRENKQQRTPRRAPVIVFTMTGFSIPNC